MEGRADIAVHSLKDVPTKMPEGLMLGAILGVSHVLDDPMKTRIAIVWGQALGFGNLHPMGWMVHYWMNKMLPRLRCI